MIRAKTHIDHKEVVYSVHDPALLEANSPEIVQDYEKNRNSAVLTKTKDMVQFTIKPLSAAMYELITQKCHLDPRIHHILAARHLIETAVREKYNESADTSKWSIPAISEWVFNIGAFNDAMSDGEKALWEDFLDSPRRHQSMWFRAGCEEILFGKEKLTVEEFEERMDVNLFPLVREEIAKLIKKMSEAGEDLGK